MSSAEASTKVPQTSAVDARQKVFLPSQPFDLPKAQRQEARKHHHGSKKREGAPHAQNSCFNARPRPVRHPEYR